MTFHKRDVVVSMPIFGEEMSAEVQLSPNRRKHKLGHRQPSRIASFQTKKQLPYISHQFIPRSCRNRFQNASASKEPLLSRTMNRRRPDLSVRMRDLRSLSPNYCYAHIRSAGADPQFELSWIDRESTTHL